MTEAVCTCFGYSTEHDPDCPSLVPTEWTTVNCSTCGRDVRALTSEVVVEQIVVVDGEPEVVVTSVPKTCRWCTTTCTACGSTEITDEQVRAWIHRRCSGCGFLNVLPS